jgi:hypothetical protein
MLWQTSRRLSRHRFKTLHRGPARSVTFEDLLLSYEHAARRQALRGHKPPVTAPGASRSRRGRP